MAKITYDQALADHEYLWDTYGSANDMTGGYVDQEDLYRLLRNPSKATARDCLCDQINYWFLVGPDEHQRARSILQSDPIVREIAERHGHL